MQIHPRLVEKMSAGVQTAFPVILYYRHPIEQVRQCIARHYGTIKYELPFINAIALELPAENIDAVAKSSMVQWITDDAAVSKVAHPHASCTPGSCGPEMTAAKQGSTSGSFGSFGGFDSFGGDLVASDLPFQGFYERRPRFPVSVAAIDTGVALHRDLLEPASRIRGFKDFVGRRSDPYDDDGHGTHIAGILCGLWGKERRPGPGLVAIKALDSEGNGNASDILAAMQWTLNNSRYYNIRVVNLSLGISPDQNYDSDPLVRGAEALTRRGLTVVAAAGNSGPAKATISSPGISPYVITVGASDGVRVASFSSRGPAPRGIIKPDLVAPGVDIISLDASHPTGYIAESGTSMATPFISRAAAALYASFPRLDPVSVRRILLRAAVPLPGEPATAQGHGLFLE